MGLTWATKERLIPMRSSRCWPWGAAYLSRLRCAAESTAWPWLEATHLPLTGRTHMLLTLPLRIRLRRLAGTDGVGATNARSCHLGGANAPLVSTPPGQGPLPTLASPAWTVMLNLSAIAAADRESAPDFAAHGCRTGRPLCVPRIAASARARSPLITPMGAFGMRQHPYGLIGVVGRCWGGRGCPVDSVFLRPQKVKKNIFVDSDRA